MGTKTISIDEEAYNRLRGQKKGKESFSDVIKRILKPVANRQSIIDFAGIWGDLSSEDMQKMIKKMDEVTDEFNNMLRQ